MAVNRPGGEISARPLHFIWIVDRSGSMGPKAKMQMVNEAINEAIPHMRDAADENPHVQVFVRALKFSNGASWYIEPAPVQEFEWRDLSADGVTDMGRALRLVAEELEIPPMPERSLPPVLVLVSDGQPTDDFGGGLQALLDQPWGRRRFAWRSRSVTPTMRCSSGS